MDLNHRKWGFVIGFKFLGNIIGTTNQFINQISNSIIIVDALAVGTLKVGVNFVLSLISKLNPIGNIGNIKEHVSVEDSSTWAGFESFVDC